MARPRIVHLYKDVYPQVEGGIERTIYHLARLHADRFHTTVITATPRKGSPPRTSDIGFELTQVRSYGRLLSTPIAPGFIGALRRAHADLFHFHFPHPTAEAAFLLSRLRTPAVVTYHSDVVRQRRALALYRPLMNRFLARMTVIMPTSRRYLESSETLAPFVSRCRVVPLGLPLAQYEPSEAGREKRAELRGRWGEFILFLGVLRYYKGLTYLIEAMKALEATHLAIAGEGPQRESLERQVAAAGLTDRVHFLGRVDQPTALALFAAAAVFCLPAHERSEAFGLCQIESMASGVPVVSTDLPTGVPEVNRHEQTGLIVAPGDPAALAGALGRLLAEPETRVRMGEAGRRRAAEFYTAERMADDVARIYREVLGA